MNVCLTIPQHEKQIGYWVSEKGKCMKWLIIYFFLKLLPSPCCKLFSSALLLIVANTRRRYSSITASVTNYNRMREIQKMVWDQNWYNCKLRWMCYFIRRPIFRYFNSKTIYLFPQKNIIYLMCLIYTIQYFKELYKM